MSYRKLNPDKIIETIELLVLRINERFPDSGLLQVNRELLAIARDAKSRSERISKRLYWLWVIIIASLLLLFGSLASIVITHEMPKGGFSLSEFVQLSDSGLNVIVVVVAVIVFLVTLETRLKRKRALEAIYELRAIGHVIDMHQLTKDPDRLKSQSRGTPSSPKLDMTPFELTRYLDYCSEMLSQLGKIAALYSQNFTDEVVLTAVNEVEDLTTGLARKIWQKIMILNTCYRDQ